MSSPPIAAPGGGTAQQAAAMTEFLTRLKRVRPPLSLVHKELPRLICTQLVQDPSSGQNLVEATVRVSQRVLMHLRHTLWGDPRAPRPEDVCTGPKAALLRSLLQPRLLYYDGSTPKEFNLRTLASDVDVSSPACTIGVNIGNPVTSDVEMLAVLDEFQRTTRHQVPQKLPMSIARDYAPVNSSWVRQVAQSDGNDVFIAFHQSPAEKNSSAPVPGTTLSRQSLERAQAFYNRVAASTVGDVHYLFDARYLPRTVVHGRRPFRLVWRLPYSVDPADVEEVVSSTFDVIPPRPGQQLQLQLSAQALQVKPPPTNASAVPASSPIAAGAAVAASSKLTTSEVKDGSGSKEREADVSPSNSAGRRSVDSVTSAPAARGDKSSLSFGSGSSSASTSVRAPAGSDTSSEGHTTDDGASPTARSSSSAATAASVSAPAQQPRAASQPQVPGAQQQQQQQRPPLPALEPEVPGLAGKGADDALKASHGRIDKSFIWYGQKASAFQRLPRAGCGLFIPYAGIKPVRPLPKGLSMPAGDVTSSGGCGEIVVDPTVAVPPVMLPAPAPKALGAAPSVPASQGAPAAAAAQTTATAATEQQPSPSAGPSSSRVGPETSISGDGTQAQSSLAAASNSNRSAVGDGGNFPPLTTMPSLLTTTASPPPPQPASQAQRPLLPLQTSVTGSPQIQPTAPAHPTPAPLQPQLAAIVQHAPPPVSSGASTGVLVAGMPSGGLVPVQAPPASVVGGGMMPVGSVGGLQQTQQPQYYPTPPQQPQFPSPQVSFAVPPHAMAPPPPTPPQQQQQQQPTMAANSNCNFITVGGVVYQRTAAIVPPALPAGQGSAAKQPSLVPALGEDGRMLYAPDGSLLYQPALPTFHEGPRRGRPPKRGRGGGHLHGGHEEPEEDPYKRPTGVEGINLMSKRSRKAAEEAAAAAAAAAAGEGDGAADKPPAPKHAFPDPPAWPGRGRGRGRGRVKGTWNKSMLGRKNDPTRTANVALPRPPSPRDFDQDGDADGRGGYDYGFDGSGDVSGGRYRDDGYEEDGMEDETETGFMDGTGTDDVSDDEGYGGDGVSAGMKRGRSSGGGGSANSGSYLGGPAATTGRTGSGGSWGMGSLDNSQDADNLYEAGLSYSAAGISGGGHGISVGGGFHQANYPLGYLSTVRGGGGSSRSSTSGGSSNPRGSGGGGDAAGAGAAGAGKHRTGSGRADDALLAAAYAGGTIDALLKATNTDADDDDEEGPRMSSVRGGGSRQKQYPISSSSGGSSKIRSNGAIAAAAALEATAKAYGKRPEEIAAMLGLKGGSSSNRRGGSNAASSSASGNTATAEGASVYGAEGGAAEATAASPSNASSSSSSSSSGAGDGQQQVGPIEVDADALDALIGMFGSAADADAVAAAAAAGEDAATGAPAAAVTEKST